MAIDFNMMGVYTHSQDVVARLIEDEMIIIPLVSGIGDMEDDLFTLNETGKAIWERLDGKRTVKDLVKDLAKMYEAPEDEIKSDVSGMLSELLERKIIVEV